MNFAILSGLGMLMGLRNAMAQIVCAGWADDEGCHPCGNTLGQTSGKGTSHGVCPSCFSLQLQNMGKGDRFIRAELTRVFREAAAR